MTDPLRPHEGGSLAAGDQASALDSSPGRETRDTVAGCRDLAVQDRLRAAAADTENGRRVLERSAASWETRAYEIQDKENVSAQQRAADRDLWAGDEGETRASPD